MAQFQEAIHRDTILIVGFPREETFDAVKLYEKEFKKKLKILVIADTKRLKSLLKMYKYKLNKDIEVISCDFDSPVEIRKLLTPYMDSLLAVTTHFEKTISEFRKVIPHLPYLNAPTSESMKWASDKIKMRQLLRQQNPKISPKYLVVKEANKAAIDKIEKTIGYPAVVKPSGLAASMLVSVCYHREELQETLKNTFARIDKIHNSQHGRGSAKILVEQLMEGTMYSVDAYVNVRGNIYFTPPVHIKTGRAIGQDDYYGYQQLTPTKLKKSSIEDLNHAASEAVKAMSLRSTTCHIELIRSEEGWKIIEINPRQGGFRHTLYNLSFGINHILNDILIRVPQMPITPKKRKGFSVALKIYPNKEGRLLRIKGVIKMRALESFHSATVHKEKGDRLLFARNGGSSVMDVILFNEDRSKLLADIRRIEKNVEVVTVTRKDLLDKIT